MPVGAMKLHTRVCIKMVPSDTWAKAVARGIGVGPDHLLGRRVPALPPVAGLDQAGLTAVGVDRVSLLVEPHQDFAVLQRDDAHLIAGVGQLRVLVDEDVLDILHLHHHDSSSWNRVREPRLRQVAQGDLELPGEFHSVWPVGRAPSATIAPGTLCSTQEKSSAPISGEGMSR